MWHSKYSPVPPITNTCILHNKFPQVSKQLVRCIQYTINYNIFPCTLGYRLVCECFSHPAFHSFARCWWHCIYCEVNHKVTCKLIFLHFGSSDVLPVGDCCRMQSFSANLGESNLQYISLSLIRIQWKCIEVLHSLLQTSAPSILTVHRLFDK
jgi:hypothetical protein